MRPSLCRLLPVLLLAFAAPACEETPGDPPVGAGGGGVLYVNGDIHMAIYSIELESGATSNLFAGADPFLTPEGTFIVRTHQGLEELAADGTTARTIVARNDQEPFDATFDNDFHNPQLSPDGQTIAYEGQFGYVFDVYLVDRQSGELLASFVRPETGQGYLRPTWTPDGRLVVAGRHDNPGLYVSDAAVRQLTRFDPELNEPTEPAVSPDGTRVAFVMNEHVFTMGLDGTGLTQLTQSDGAESWPTWSPDGERLACYGGNSILLVPAEGGDVFDLRSISDELDSFMTFTSTLDGQLHWR